MFNLSCGFLLWHQSCTTFISNAAMSMSTPKSLQKIAVDPSKATPFSHDRVEDTEDGLYNGMQQEVFSLTLLKREWGRRVKICSYDVKDWNDWDWWTKKYSDYAKNLLWCYDDTKHPS